MAKVNKAEVGKLARDVFDYAERKCYGLGECGYYFREWAKDYTDETDEDYLKELASQAEELAYKLDDQRKEYGI